MDTKKRLFVVHGWGGSSQGDWIPWVVGEATRMGFDVVAPDMPDTDLPDIKAWVETLRDVVGGVDEDTYFIGHSIGCQTIMRFLETATVSPGGVIFIAGWFTLTGLEEDELAVAKPWVETPIDFEVLARIMPSPTLILSEDDPYVPFKETKTQFEERLGSSVVVVPNAGHFTAEDGFTTLPVVTEVMTKNGWGSPQS